VLLGIFVAQPVFAAGPRCEKTSGPSRTALLELYTSEGCDSCPPADQFVRTLYTQGFSAETVVPLSLHVDYWDYIGWKDRFANPLFTQRQYVLTAAAHRRTVYTPEIFLSGREDRDWQSSGVAAAVRAINALTAPVTLTLRQVPGRGDEVAVNVQAVTHQSDAAGAWSLFFAVYENDLTSKVNAGENRGATLRHGFVVRQWATPVTLNRQGEADIRWRQPFPQDARRENIGFAAFVENTRTGEVLQALALPACAS